MESDIQSVFSHHAAPPVFDGQNYQAWAVRMTVYLDAMDLWEVVEDDYVVQPLPANPMVAQIKIHKERKTRKSKAISCLYSAVSSTIFTRIMNLNSAKAIWDYLKNEYQDYSDKLLGIVNKVRLLGKDFSDDRIIQKILVTLPEKYDSKISSLEESKDLSSISLAELVNALQAQEQRRIMRKEGTVEDALKAKSESSGGKDKKFMEK
ncbi:uncharacterized protein LOC119370272 [Jatropha curcas]|uniref:uncharacterized protein LOC119370272 n=1 Tax=Jatropha curcas TaxID=180498 RepID=UPI0018960F1E|nr:uncharacterized protein LOC119370272 [Jatropha curcas]